MNKRGISAIVATVLIILITVAAIAIIWVAIIPMIQEGFDFEDPDLRFDIVTSGGYTFYDDDVGKLYVQIKRGSDDLDIVGLDIIVTIDGNSKTYKYNSSYVPGPNQAITIVIPMVIGGGTPDSIRVIPVVKSGNVIRRSDVVSEAEVEESSEVEPMEVDKSNCDNDDDCPNDGVCVEGVCEEVVANCTDEIQNQDETGIDCGGVCGACPLVCTGIPTYVSPVDANASNSFVSTPLDAIDENGITRWLGRSVDLEVIWFVVDRGFESCLSGINITATNTNYLDPTNVNQTISIEVSSDKISWELVNSSWTFNDYSIWNWNSFEESSARYIRLNYSYTGISISTGSDYPFGLIYELKVLSRDLA